MSERKSLSGGDWLAICAFGIGALVAILMAYGLWTGVGGSSGSAAIAAFFAGSVGPLPALIAGAGIAFLGARAFLTGDRANLVIGILGVLGLAVGLSVIAGSLSDSRGGSFGAGTGGRISDMTHPAVGILLGAILAFGAAYFAWMREDPAAAAKLAPARRLTPAPPKSDDGVTAAESAMLFPAERAVAEAPPQRPAAATAPTRPPLYPEDVRLKGQIPPGTVPLATPGVAPMQSAIPETAEPAVYRWTAPRASPDVAAEEVEALGAVESVTPEPIEDVVEELAAELTAEISEEPEVRPLPPSPSWETTGLAEDDEPVDAYGTPLSLVERARQDRGAPLELDEDAELAPAVARIPREIGDEDADDEQDAGELTALVIEPEEVEIVVTELEVAEVDVTTELAAEVVSPTPSVDLEPAPLSLLDELRAHNAQSRAAAETEDDDVLEAEVTAELVEVEPSAPIDADAELAEIEEELQAIESLADADAEVGDDEEDEIDEDEPAEVVSADADEEVDADDEEESDADEDLESALDDEPEEELEEVAAEAEPQAPVAPVVEPKPARAKPAAAAAGLFDSVEPEPEVVLKPQAAVPASRAEKAPGRGIDPEKKLLVEVGCMFVERGRVAVSMLQRQYDMDFDQACRVLDDLQEMGLIGPYMGGKNRDILLTRDAWLEKVGAE